MSCLMSTLGILSACPKKESSILSKSFIICLSVYPAISFAISGLLIVLKYLCHHVCIERARRDKSLQDKDLHPNT